MISNLKCPYTEEELKEIRNNFKGDKLICPFCQQELEEETFYRGRVFVSCNNPNCTISDWGGCSKQIITELIRTRKALDVANEKLRHCVNITVEELEELLKSLNKIALEQKDSK